MNTLIKITLALFVSVFFSSCVFEGTLGFGRAGNGNVVSENRPVDKPFDAVDAGQGIEVVLAISENPSIRVEADENLLELIETRIEGSTLILRLEKSISKSRSLKVFVEMPEVRLLEVSSGATMRGSEPIRTNELELSASSGGELKLEVATTSLVAKASSGGTIDVFGTASNLNADASSGAVVNASKLKADYVEAEASSGADIRVSAQESLTAHTGSGGDIHYSGTPKELKLSGSLKN